jgi:hypothetical protein
MAHYFDLKVRLRSKFLIEFVCAFFEMRSDDVAVNGVAAALIEEQRKARAGQVVQNCLYDFHYVIIRHAP